MKKDCKHKNTIIVGDSDWEKVYCIDCEVQEDESEYTARMEQMPF